MLHIYRRYFSCAKLFIGLLAFNLMAVGIADATDFTDTGPLRIRDQFLLNMSLLAFEADASSVLKTGTSRVEVIGTVSNTFAMSNAMKINLERRGTRQPITLDDLRATPGNGFYLDAEVYRTAISIDRSVAEGLQIGITFQWLSFIGGSLDGFIEGFHDTFNFEQGGREVVPRNVHITYIRSNGMEVFDYSTPGLSLGDIVLRAKSILTDNYQHSVVSLQTSLKLPHGRGDDLFGSGSVDAGVQLLGSYYPSTTFYIHYSMGILRLGEWQLFDLPSQTLLSGMFGLTLRTSPSSSLIAQLTASQSPFFDLDLPELRAVSLQLSLGYKHAFSNSITLFGAATENIANFDNTADIGFHAGISVNF